MLCGTKLASSFLKDGEMEKEIEIPHIVDAFNSHDCYILSVAWIKSEGLRFETWFLERY